MVTDRILAFFDRLFRSRHTPRHSVEDILDRQWTAHIHDLAVYRRSMGWA